LLFLFIAHGATPVTPSGGFAFELCIDLALGPPIAHGATPVTAKGGFAPPAERGLLIGGGIVERVLFENDDPAAEDGGFQFPIADFTVKSDGNGISSAAVFWIARFFG
jgi:hypothetical protein